MAARFVLSGQQILTGPGKPASLGKINFWGNGGVINQDTFPTAALTGANANPVILSSTGRVPEIWANDSDVFAVRILASDNSVIVSTVQDISFLTPFSLSAASVLAVLNGNVASVVLDGADMAGSAFADFIAAFTLGAAGSIDASAGSINLGDVSGPTTFAALVTLGNNLVSDADSTDDLGTNSVRWANLFVDAITLTANILGSDATFQKWRRCKVNAGGTLQNGSIGVDSSILNATGDFSVTLSSPVTNKETAVVIATVESSGGAFICSAKMTNTTVCEIRIDTNAGAAISLPFSVLIFDEAAT